MSKATYLSEESRIFTLIFEKRTADVIAAIEQGIIGVNHQYIHSALDTPLIWAVITDNLELAQWLLEHGAHVNYQQAKYRMTALHIAARRGSTAMCELLLVHKADVSIRERGGMTAGELVTSTRCMAVRKLSADVQRVLGVDQWAGAYRDTSQDPENVAFWGKLGPPPPLTQEDRDRDRAERAASKAKKAARRAEKARLAAEQPPSEIGVAVVEGK